MAGKKKRSATRRGKRTLAIDIGGIGIKMVQLDAEGRALTDRVRRLTPQPGYPTRVMKVIRDMIDTQIAEVGAFDRVSVGFPGVMVRGCVRTAPNLSTERWRGFSLERAIAKYTGKPVRAINDADLQGYGVIRGTGVELVLTLGTGLGAALFAEGQLFPNLELGHHPFETGKTYEQLVADKELKRIGKSRWEKRVHRILAQLEPILNYDLLHLGGGNADNLDRKKLPRNVRLFGNVKGMTGGIRLWDG